MNLETGEPVASCTIIATGANALTRAIHDRMPVVLDRADIGPWLKGAAGIELLKPAFDAAQARRNKHCRREFSQQLFDVNLLFWSCCRNCNLTILLARLQFAARAPRGLAPCQLIAPLNMACLGRRQQRRWVKLLTPPAKNSAMSASFKWCAKSLPNELLQRHAEVSLTRFAYGRQH
jgi:SOS response associated peptidase (SRAP)